jgi:hypothetical protein
VSLNVVCVCKISQISYSSRNSDGIKIKIVEHHLCNTGSTVSFVDRHTAPCRSTRPQARATIPKHLAANPPSRAREDRSAQQGCSLPCARKVKFRLQMHHDTRSLGKQVARVLGNHQGLAGVANGFEHGCWGRETCWCDGVEMCVLCGVER